MPHVTLNVHEEPISIDFTILNFEDAVLEIDWTHKGKKQTPLTPEIEATFGEWWQGLPTEDQWEYLQVQHDAEESYAEESRFERQREEGW